MTVSTLLQHETLLKPDHYGTYAGALARTVVKTANYAAAAGDLVPVDTTGGAVTVTLPSPAADRSRLAIKHILQGGTNTVTVACGGSDVFNRTGGATTLTLSLLAQGVLLEYTASAGIWTVVADDIPLSQLDGRFVPLHDVPTTFVTKTTTYTAAGGEFVLASTTGGGWTLTLPASPNVGEAVGIKKTTSDANTLTVSPNVDGAALTLTTPNRTVVVVWDGATWRAATGAPHHLSHEYGGSDALTTFAHQVQVDVYTVAGTYTWTKPAWAQTLDVSAIGAGGGGGSGRKAAAGLVRCGGGGGGGGALAFGTLAASDVGPTVGVTVGAGGTGGAAQTAASTDGNAGTSGGASFLGDTAATALLGGSNGGGGGGGGTAAAGTAGGNANGTLAGGSGAAASGSGGAGNQGAAAAGASGGGSGGGITSGDAESAGGPGGIQQTRRSVTAPAGGAVATGGGNAVAVGASSPLPGQGGGGGGSSKTGNAGGGGNGVFGSGGGAGGAALNAVGNSGAGGNGGDGFVIIVSRG